MCQSSTNFKEMSPQGIDIKDKVEIACVNASILATSFAFLFPDWPHGQNGSPLITWENGACSSDSDGVSDITGWPEWLRPSTVHEETGHKHEPDREIQAERWSAGTQGGKARAPSWPSGLTPDITVKLVAGIFFVQHFKAFSAFHRAGFWISPSYLATILPSEMNKRGLNDNWWNCQFSDLHKKTGHNSPIVDENPTQSV